MMNSEEARYMARREEEKYYAWKTAVKREENNFYEMKRLAKKAEEEYESMKSMSRKEEEKLYALRAEVQDLLLQREALKNK